MQRLIPQIVTPNCSAPVRRERGRFKHFVAGVGLASVVLIWSGSALAGEYLYDFNPPNGDPATLGFALFGANAANAWHTNGGFTGATNDGFLEITPAQNNENLGVIFPPDLYTNTDGSTVTLPLIGFKLEADVRIGNATGNNGRPADGFSISFASINDPVIFWGSQGQFRGWAGGDSVAQAIEPPSFNYVNGEGFMDPSVCDSGTAENGTKTGVAVQFDTWQGNTIINENGAAPGTGNDNVGWRVHYNGKMLVRIQAQPPSGPLPSSPDPGGADVNGLAVCPAIDASFDQDPSCTAAVCGDTNSIQTGIFSADSEGDVTNLCWTHFTVELTTNLPHQLTVTFKGRPLVDHLALTNFQPYVGQIVMGGRTGGANENRDVDNVHLTTYSSVQAVFDKISSVSAFINDFSLTFSNIGPAKITSITGLTLDGVDITADSHTTISIADPQSKVTYNSPTPFNSLSSHSVTVTFADALGHTNLTVSGFTTFAYTTLAASSAVPASSIDLTQPGFRVLPHQTTQSEPNRLYWADEQLEGLHGANLVDVTPYTHTNNEIQLNDVIDFANTGAGGQFPIDNDWGLLGIPASGLTSDDNSAIGVSAYLYFPTAGTYIMGANSDDGVRVTFAKNSHDLLGTPVPGITADGGRGIGFEQNLGAVIVPTPGYYGFRLLWENGGGGSAVEWYTIFTPSGGSTNVLINDLNNNPTTAVKAYQFSSAAPPYVSFAEPPLGDDNFFPNTPIKYELTDGAATVSSGSVGLKVNGVAQSPTVNSASGVTTIVQVAPSTFWPVGSNYVELTFKDSANSNYNYAYSFTVQPYATLTTDVWSPPGSGSNPGFHIKSYQSPNTNIVSGWKNTIQMANQALDGFYYDNVAVLTAFTHNGEYWEPGVINYSENNGATVTQNGNFRDTSTPPMPDIAFPGIGLWTPPAGGPAPGDNCAMQVVSFVEFPNAGFYIMGVNSDDGFRVTEGEASNASSMLTVVAPASIAGPAPAMANINGTDGSSFGGPLPKPPITAQAVVCDPLWPTNTPNNAAALAGKIAILKRDATGGVAVHSIWAQNAGAVAEVIVFSDGEDDASQPGEWGATSGTTNPVVTTSYKVGTNLIAHATTDATSPVTVQIGDDSSLQLGIFNQGRGASDTLFGVYVPQAGLYPLRLIWENGGGDLNCEWFTQDATTGAKTLINATNSPVKAWIARTGITRPTINIARQGSTVTITYTGTLLSSPTANGTYTPVSGATNPYTVPLSGSANFYRSQ